MNKAELFEAQKRQREYDMMDRRMGEQRVIDEVTDKFEARIIPVEKRITSLEHSRTRFKGVLYGISVAFSTFIAWIKYGSWHK